MSYEYTDMDGAPLRVEAFHGSRVGEQVHITTSRDGTYVNPEDAPAVALATLNAAGITEDAPDPNKPQKPEEVAVYWLIQGEKHKAVKAEREAEDAKVQEWRNALITRRNRPGTPTAWADLEEWQRNEIRADYRAARDFFGAGQ